MSGISDEDVIAQRLDLEMLERPHLWPGVVKGLRCVHLKRRTAGRIETGPCILWGTNPDEYVVVGHSWGGEFTRPDVHRYDSPDAILADGWKVD